MGIFHEMVRVFNVAPIALTARFDGQDTRLPPGESSLPKVALNYAKNQNPVMGTSDPNNPSISGGQYLIRVVGVDDCTPLTKAEWEDHLGRPCRLNWEELMDGKVNPGQKVAFKGKNQATQAKGIYDQGVRVRSNPLESDNA